MLEKYAKLFKKDKKLSDVALNQLKQHNFIKLFNVKFINNNEEFLPKIGSTGFPIHYVYKDVIGEGSNRYLPENEFYLQSSEIIPNMIEVFFKDILIYYLHKYIKENNLAKYITHPTLDQLDSSLNNNSSIIVLDSHAIDSLFKSTGSIETLKNLFSRNNNDDLLYKDKHVYLNDADLTNELVVVDLTKLEIQININTFMIYRFYGTYENSDKPQGIGLYPDFRIISK